MISVNGVEMAAPLVQSIAMGRFLMSSYAAAFNRSVFARFINGPFGRLFRLVAGIGFLIIGLSYRDHLLGVLSLIWSVFPLSAGAFDICYISAALGGPISGQRIRSIYQAE
jgi:hypothetical protein